jgi:hypothetical protein
MGNLRSSKSSGRPDERLRSPHPRDRSALRAVSESAADRGMESEQPVSDCVLGTPALSPHLSSSNSEWPRPARAIGPTPSHRLRETASKTPTTKPVVPIDRYRQRWRMRWTTLLSIVARPPAFCATTRFPIVACHHGRDRPCQGLGLPSDWQSEPIPPRGIGPAPKRANIHPIPRPHPRDIEWRAKSCLVSR